MNEKLHLLGIVDYVVIIAMLVTSMVIGIKFQLSGKHQKNAQEYLLAGKNMWKFPVVFSIVATFFSSSPMIGIPSENYRFGAQQILNAFTTMILGIVFAAYFVIPVFFKCKVSSAYEFLEIRYGKISRRMISAFFIIQMVLLMSAILYAPVLALSAVTDLSLEMSIIIIGFVCTFYCAIGGLKAVLWTDVLQASLMFICLFAVYVQGILEVGGVAEIFKRSREGGRLNVLQFDFDFTTRYTVWNVLLTGFVTALAFHGTSQVEVQRVLSLSTVERAQSSLLWSTIPMSIILCMCNGLGLVLYAVYHSCDPVLNKVETGLTKYDQLLPHYIVTRFSAIPGLTGLCIAGIFSGSLSSLSSMLNSVSTVTVVDFIKPALSGSDWLTERKTVYLAKFLSVLYGLIYISLAFSLQNSDSILAVTYTLYCTMEGPILGIFVVGMFSRKANEKCALFGVLTGVAFSSFVGYGTLFSGYRYPSLPFSTRGCPSVLNASDILFENSTTSCLEMNCNSVLNVSDSLFENSTTSCLEMNCNSYSLTPSPGSEPFSMFRVSFQWLPIIGVFITVLFTFIAVLLTGWNKNEISVDSECLSPLTSLWMKQESVYKKSSSVSHENIKMAEMVVFTAQVPDATAAQA